MPPRRIRAKPSQVSKLSTSQELNKHSSNDSHSIHRLPNELLQEIFYQHVWANFDTPVRLILVCRLWNAVGSFPALWGNIYFGNDFYWSQLDEEDNLCYQMDGMIYCSDHESLNRAIARTGSSKFELTMCMYHDSKIQFRPDLLDEPAFSSRCRLIRLITPYTLTSFIDWMGNIRFTALEELLFMGRYNVSTSCTSTLLAKLREGSPRLWNLAINPSWSEEFSQSIRGVLPRLKKLTMGYVTAMLRDPLAGDRVFPNLEELIICQENVIPYHRGRMRATINTPMPSLKRVLLRGGSLYTLSAAMCGQLTHLTLICGSFWNTSFEGVVKLPLLTYLALHSSWKNIRHVDAPGLVTLVLQNVAHTHAFETEELDKISILPEILYIDWNLRTKGFSRFLNQNGKNLKSLFITHVKQGDTVSETLAYDLIGRRGEAASCPFLQRLDVLIPESHDLDVTMTIWNRLQRVTKSREWTGHLRRVRYGYYSLPKNSSETLEYASRKWWMIKWNEILML